MFRHRRATTPQACILLTMFLLFLVGDSPALAQRGRGAVRSTSRASVNTRSVDRSANVAGRPGAVLAPVNSYVLVSSLQAAVVGDLA